MLKRFNTHENGGPKKREKKQGAEIIFKGILAENFLKLINGSKSQIQKLYKPEA